MISKEEYKRVLILGEHPMVIGLVHQYQAMGFVVERQNNLSECRDVVTYDELFLFPKQDIDAIEADYIAVETLKHLAAGYDLAKHDNKRLLCHLLLRSQTMLWMIQTMDFPKEINHTFEVYPFTIEDQWAKNVLVKLPGLHTHFDYPTLDREPITKDSRKMVHLVISGFSDQAIAFAIHAALVAHFPNYHASDNQPIRTRITFVDNDICPRRDEFVAKYQHLFENSYYRTVFPDKKDSKFHAPEIKGCSDVEWEFVDASIFHPVMVEKLAAWANSPIQQLSIAITHESQRQNISEAVGLPVTIYEQGTTVYLRVKDAQSVTLLRQSRRYRNIYPFGMEDCDYDVLQPLMRMAKLLNAYYSGLVKVEQGIDSESMVDESWHNLPSYAKRFSNVYNVMSIPTKMRSLGHDEEDWDTFYAITEQEIQEIAEVEHNRWNVEELILGFRPCTEDEKKEIAENISEYMKCQEEELLDKWKIKDSRGRPCTLKEIYKEDTMRRAHYDLRPYGDLQIDKTGQNVKRYDSDLSRCIPLLANIFKKGGVQ